jgi:hypothetical protein
MDGATLEWGGPRPPWRSDRPRPTRRRNLAASARCWSGTSVRCSSGVAGGERRDRRGADGGGDHPIHRQNAVRLSGSLRTSCQPGPMARTKPGADLELLLSTAAFGGARCCHFCSSVPGDGPDCRGAPLAGASRVPRSRAAAEEMLRRLARPDRNMAVVGSSPGKEAIASPFGAALFGMHAASLRRR